MTALQERDELPSKLPSARSASHLAPSQFAALAHNLRRTAATLMAPLGVSTDVIDKCLDHKLQSKVARVYIKDRRQAE